MTHESCNIVKTGRNLSDKDAMIISPKDAEFQEESLGTQSGQQPIKYAKNLFECFLMEKRQLVSTLHTQHWTPEKIFSLKSANTSLKTAKKRH